VVELGRKGPVVRNSDSPEVEKVAEGEMDALYLLKRIADSLEKIAKALYTTNKGMNMADVVVLVAKVLSTSQPQGVLDQLAVGIMERFRKKD
jgi:hypothetical protein